MPKTLLFEASFFIFHQKNTRYIPELYVNSGLYCLWLLQVINKTDNKLLLEIYLQNI